jgi:hypothetical protein
VWKIAVLIFSLARRFQQKKTSKKETQLPVDRTAEILKRGHTCVQKSSQKGRMCDLVEGKRVAQVPRQQQNSLQAARVSRTTHTCEFVQVVQLLGHTTIFSNGLR